MPEAPRDISGNIFRAEVERSPEVDAYRAKILKEANTRAAADRAAMALGITPNTNNRPASSQ